MQDFCHVRCGWISMYIIGVFQIFYSNPGTIILVISLTSLWMLFCFPPPCEGRHLCFVRIFESSICVYHSSGLRISHFFAQLHIIHKSFCTGILVALMLLPSINLLHAFQEVSKCLHFFPSVVVDVSWCLFFVCLFFHCWFGLVFCFCFLNPSDMILLLHLLV